MFKKFKINEIRLIIYIFFYFLFRRVIYYGDLLYEIVLNLSFGILNWNVGLIIESLYIKKKCKESDFKLYILKLI